VAGKEAYTVVQVVEALRATKGMKGPAARKLGCSWQTVDNYSKRHTTVARAIAEEREMMLDVGELSLARAVQNGEAWAVCFYLKTQGKERGYVERVEQENRGTVTHEHRIAGREDHFERLFAQLDAYRTGFDDGHGEGDRGKPLDSGRADDTPASIPQPPS
jgi:hypothetical protein